MAGRGPAPKPAHLRQRTNKKAGAIQLLPPPELPSGVDVPAIPNPDGRYWHPLTVVAWGHAWASPMASQWLEADADALGRLAVCWDDWYKMPRADVLGEIRLQEARFGLSPLDRSRLQWEVSRAGEAEQKQIRSVATTQKRTGTHDPRRMLMAVK